MDGAVPRRDAARARVACLDDGQHEELGAVLLRQDRVDAGRLDALAHHRRRHALRCRRRNAAKSAKYRLACTGATHKMKACTGATP